MDQWFLGFRIEIGRSEGAWYFKVYDGSQLVDSGFEYTSQKDALRGAKDAIERY